MVHTDSFSPCYDEQERLQRLHVLSEALTTVLASQEDHLRFDGRLLNPEEMHVSRVLYVSTL